MARLVAVLVVACCCLSGGVAAAQAPPPPHVDVGIGEQDPSFFGDPLFRETGIRHARLIVPFDVVRAGGWQLSSADAWLAQRATAASNRS